MGRFDANRDAISQNRWKKILSTVDDMLPEEVPNNESYREELERLQRAIRYIYETVPRIFIWGCPR